MIEGKPQLALYGLFAKIVEDYITELSETTPEEGFTYETEDRISVHESVENKVAKVVEKHYLAA